MIPLAALERDILIVACAISAGIHAALVREHLAAGAGSGGGFLASVVLLAGLVVVLTRGPVTRTALVTASAVLLGLLVSYALAVTTGIPLLHPQAEHAEGLALATKAVEILGLLVSLHLLRRRGAAVALSFVQPKGTPT